MKKFWERLKDMWCGMLPILLIFGIPLAMAIAVWLVSNWNDIPKILGIIANIGKGSLLCGIILILFAVVGLVNAGAAFMMWVFAFTKWLNRKAKSRFWFWCIIIVVTFGWYALFKLIKLL